MVWQVAVTVCSYGQDRGPPLRGHREVLNVRLQPGVQRFPHGYTGVRFLPSGDGAGIQRLVPYPMTVTRIRRESSRYSNAALFDALTPSTQFLDVQLDWRNP
jgi:hypothetical protein